MSKLEEKLIELGYCKYSNSIYVKLMTNLGYLKINLEIDISNLTGRISTNTKYYFEKEAKTFVEAFNVLQNDLEVLKEYE